LIHRYIQFVHINSVHTQTHPFIYIHIQFIDMHIQFIHIHIYIQVLHIYIQVIHMHIQSYTYTYL